MATLGTFTAGQVLTAAELNAIGTWTTWSPTVTAQTGTITTLGTVTGRYVKINKLVVAYIYIGITTNGTGASNLNFTLPVASANVSPGAFLGVVRELAATGVFSGIWLDPSGTSARINRLDTLAYPAANGYAFGGFFQYEAA